jgi:protein gp37
MPQPKRPGLNRTNIAWTDFTWNPIVGCTKCSPGCDNCYALLKASQLARNPKLSPWLQKRYDATVVTRDGKPEWSGYIALFPERLLAPLSRKKPAKIFVGSMGDLFHPSVPDEYIDQIFAVMAATPHLTYQILTKRPGRMLEYLTAPVQDGFTNRQDCIAGMIPAGYVWDDRGSNRYNYIHVPGPRMTAAELNRRIKWPGWPLPNVWIGASASNQAMVDKFVPILLRCPAAVRFVSYEPGLGPVDMEPWLPIPEDAMDGEGNPVGHCYQCDGGGTVEYQDHPELWGEDVMSEENHPVTCPGCAGDGIRVDCQGPFLDSVIAGGETGEGARPMDPQWARDLRDQCKAAGVAYFFKQMSGKAEIPDDLLIQEYPGVKDD